MREKHLESIRESCTRANNEKFGYGTRERPHINPVGEIRLADVLLAIPVGLKRTTAMALVAPTPSGEELMWNLRKDNLEEQTIECLQFLASLLTDDTV